jgi:two-component system alkaline phosphatase synthesis response regulator PhoP
VVDDEPDVRRLLEVQLGLIGYKSKLASNGDEAIALAKAEKPIVIIMDIAMPGMDGAEACFRLKQLDGLKDVPIILFTAIDHDLIPSLTIAVEADGYMAKPLEIEKVQYTLDKVLKK